MLRQDERVVRPYQGLAFRVVEIGPHEVASALPFEVVEALAEALHPADRSQLLGLPAAVRGRGARLVEVLVHVVLRHQPMGAVDDQC